ncbi:MAG: hypothetical protein P8175_15610, partial [Deltaproteobacteria bacterium]
MNRDGCRTETGAILLLHMGTAPGRKDDFDGTPATDHGGRLDSLIRRHEGRIIETRPERLLAEFGSSVRAVQCAQKIRDELTGRGAILLRGGKPVFGIGIGGTGVRGERGRRTGAELKIASRLSQLAKLMVENVYYFFRALHRTDLRLVREVMR